METQSAMTYTHGWVQSRNRYDIVLNEVNELNCLILCDPGIVDVAQFVNNNVVLIKCQLLIILV